MLETFSAVRPRRRLQYVMLPAQAVASNAFAVDSHKKAVPGPRPFALALPLSFLFTLLRRSMPAELSKAHSLQLAPPLSPGERLHAIEIDRFDHRHYAARRARMPACMLYKSQ
jgi:hypothetical protein